MSTVSRRTLTETVTRHEMYLPLPSNYAELDKLLCSAKAYATEHGLTYDDSLTVEADSEEVRIVHEVRSDG
jgi:hypothetical protein